MARHRTSTYTYDTTSIQIRSDLNVIRKERNWNLRKMVEDFLLTQVTLEDLNYAEAVRLEKEMAKRKAELEQTNAGAVKI